MEALGLSRLEVIVLDMHTDIKGFSLLTLKQVRLDYPTTILNFLFLFLKLLPSSSHTFFFYVCGCMFNKQPEWHDQQSNLQGALGFKLISMSPLTNFRIHNVSLSPKELSISFQSVCILTRAFNIVHENIVCEMLLSSCFQSSTMLRSRTINGKYNSLSFHFSHVFGGVLILICMFSQG